MKLSRSTRISLPKPNLSQKQVLAVADTGRADNPVRHIHNCKLVRYYSRFV